LTDQLGIPADAREAMAFAVLGALAQDGVPITLRNVTGRDDGPRRAGAWAYP
jgi:1,6-anhydro-N-acetylmuramate kinase